MNKIEDHKAQELIIFSQELSCPYELNKFLQSLVDSAAKLTDSQACSICVFEPETELLKFIAAPLSHRDRMRRFRIPLDNSVAGKVFQEGKPLIIQNTSGNPLVFRAVDEELPFVTHSIAAMPIIYRDEVLGVLEVLNKHEHQKYTEEDQLVLQIIANYAAVAISNSAFIEDAQQAIAANKELERLKSDFASNVFNKFRSLLGIILGQATFLNETIQLKQYKQQLEAILDSTLQLKKLVNDFSDTNLEQKGPKGLNYQRVDIGELIRQISAEFHLDAQSKNINLETNTPGDVMWAEVDVEKVCLALSNLLRNAIKYTGVDGKVLITAENLPGFVKIAIIDNGMGIPASKMDRIFDRFYQVETHQVPKHAGMGLGLPVAKIMVELHGGKIWADSIEGKGSIFSILLPACEENPA